MATTIIGNGPPYMLIYADEAPSGEFGKVVVDGGVVQLDKSSHNDNYAHVFIKGTLNEGESYLKIEDAASNVLVKVDHTGKLNALVGITAPEITSIANATATNAVTLATITPKVTANETAIAAHVPVLADHTNAINANTSDRTLATHLATDQTLVRRKNDVDGTEFSILTVNVVNVGQAAAAYGDSTFQWIDQDVNGNNINNSFARLGTNIVELGDLSEAGNGLELSAVPLQGQTKNNKIELFPEHSAPSIQLQCSKTPGVPWVRMKDEAGNTCIEFERHGVSNALVYSENFIITPGNVYTGTLSRGVQRFTFLLNGNWTTAAGDLVIKLTSDGYVQDHFISNLDVAVDQSDVNSYISSVVYVGRVSKHYKQSPTESEVRIVLKKEDLGGETFIPSGSKIVLTIQNNKLII